LETFLICTTNMWP